MTWMWPFSLSPGLDWLQIEISTHCSGTCHYCPRTLFKEQWQSRHMDVELFTRLLPTLRKTRLIHLQGWGEPFTHPEFFTFARIAKKAGCRVSTTTNGTYLDERRCERLVAEGIDIVGLSLAGTGKDNDHNRGGSNLAQVLSVVETIRRIKERTGTLRPAVHIAFLLLRSGLADLHRLVDLLRGKGIAQVVISTLDLVGSMSLVEETINLEAADGQAVRRQLETAAKAGAAVGLPMHFQMPAPKSEQAAPLLDLDVESLPQMPGPARCTENIQRAAFIGVTGLVSPCVQTNLPIIGDIRHWVDGKEQTYTPMVFGSIEAQSFTAIWRSMAYAAFRKAHGAGMPPPVCLRCPRLALRADAPASAK